MSDKPLILIMDTNRSSLELLSQQLGQEGFETLGITSLEELDQVIPGKDKISLSLIDISGFDQGIWGACDKLHQLEIPFIIIAPQRSPAIQRDSMKHGASCLLTKPLSTRDLMEHIHTLLGD
jgi:CheY-like chemotaxis protein